MRQQPDIRAVFSRRGHVLFEDDALGTITTWVDALGETHDTHIDDAVSIVARHPGPVPHPWYAIALSAFGPAVIQ